MSGTRGVPYPGRHLGRWLEQAIRDKIAEGGELNSAAAVGRWLGHAEPTRMNKWIKGRLLPQREDYPDLARLGLPEEEIHELVVCDRLQALALDESVDERQLFNLAARLACLDGASGEELMEFLEKAAFREF